MQSSFKAIVKLKELHLKHKNAGNRVATQSLWTKGKRTRWIYEKPESNVNSTKALLKSRVSEADQHNTQKHSKYEYGDGSNHFGFCVAWEQSQVLNCVRTT